MVLAPIAILAGILLYVNNKLRRGLGDQLLDEQDTAGTGDATDAVPAGDDPGAATSAGPSASSADPTTPG